MSFARNIIIDGVRKYHFFIGFLFEYENQVYRINRMEEMIWNETSTTTGSRIAAIGAGLTVTVDFDKTLTPKEGFAYWFEFIGIDGFCGYQVLHKGYPHNAPARRETFLFKEDAGRFNGKYLPHIILNPDFPTYKFTNPKAFVNIPHMYFRGEKWDYSILKEGEAASERARIGTIPRLENYMVGSMPG